jgi:outer membrane autotransporter protein
VPTIGNVSGNVSAVSGNQIAVADISSLAAADNQLSDTLDGLSGVLDMAHAHGKGQWWISSFGGVSDVDGSSSAPQADHSFGGLAAGGHTVFGNGMLIGVFGGLSKSVHQADVSNGARTEGTGFFGGLYGGYSSEAFALDFTLTAGNIRNDGTRIVANNTVATGFETAKSSHDSFFIAPELTLSSMPMAIGGVGFTPSLRVRYELQKSGSFAETGLTSGALTMGSATSHALKLRLQGAFPVALNDPASTLTFRTGIDARFATDSGRQATLLGVVTNGAGAGNESSGSGFAGFDFSHALSNTATLLASGELQAGTTGLSAVANFGIRVQF